MRVTTVASMVAAHGLVSSAPGRGVGNARTQQVDSVRPEELGDPRDAYRVFDRHGLALQQPLRSSVDAAFPGPAKVRILIGRREVNFEPREAVEVGLGRIVCIRARQRLPCLWQACGVPGKARTA